MTDTNIDWTEFDNDPESTCSCRCGTDFRSHVKVFYEGGERIGPVTRKSCPGCGRNDGVNAIRSDPEIQSISR